MEQKLSPLLEAGETAQLAHWLDLLAAAGESLCGEGLWAREDGRALSAFIEDLRLHARDVALPIEADDLPRVLRDAMDRVAVRPPYGGHPRVAIYGLLEARMTRADLVICSGLNEGTWPPRPATDPLLAPGVLRALGVPGADFRIGLSAHDLAGALGAPEVVLTRARRDLAGPAIASRFLLRVRALLGEDLVQRHEDHDVVELARALEPAPLELPRYPRPEPCPSAEMRRQDISVTALDRLRSDPYQYYASKLLRLGDLDHLDAAPDTRLAGRAGAQDPGGLARGEGHAGRTGGASPRCHVRPSADACAVASSPVGSAEMGGGRACLQTRNGARRSGRNGAR